MKNFTIIYSLVFCNSIASAQVSEDWLRAESSNDYLGTMIARDAGNNVFTVGYNFKILGGGTDIFVTKRDESGSLLWTNNFDNTTGQQWDAATWITIDPSGDAIVTGYTNSPLTNYVPIQLIVMKFRGTDGMLLFRKTYSTGSACRAWRVLTDDAGNIYVGGDTLAQRIDHVDYGSLMVKKYSPDGNEIWSVNKDAAGNLMQGPMTSMKFGKDGNIVIAGVRGHAPYKNEAAELTTDGTVLWSREETGFGATDVTSTTNGFVYQLWNDGNVRINKLTSTGSLLWSKTYDFGTGNLGKKIEADQNDDLIITGYVVQETGMPYTDWMTFKISSAGDLLWSDRYNKHSNNDEFPNFMALDNGNNIYITGQGGPFPGGSNLGALQMVTIKYLPGGSKEWTALNDTIAQSGIALCLTSNNGICVVGSPFAFTIHYTQETSGSCDVPAGLSVTNLKKYKATVKWNAVPNAVAYHVHYKTNTCETYTELTTESNTIALSNLLIGTGYEVKVQTECIGGVSAFSNVVAFNTSGNGYCETTSLDASTEFIDLVWLEGIFNAGDNTSGYQDYTNLSASLVAGATYNVTLSASLGSSPVYFKVWIDFTRNGKFGDTGEKIVAFKTSSIGSIQKTFTVPISASSGGTKMRVSMKYGSTPGTCETFDRGQVQDYFIYLQPPRLYPEWNSEADFTGSITAYPNPVNTQLNITWAGVQPTRELSYTVFDIEGRVVKSGIMHEDQNSHNLNVSDLKNGFYLTTILDHSGTQWRVKFTKD
jgi:hypothetical protein